MKKIVFLLAIAFAAIGCSNDDDGNNTPVTAAVSFKFTQNWGVNDITPSNYTTGVYENSAGNYVSINRLRYLISRIELHKAELALKYNLKYVQDKNLKLTTANG